jgi:hypothetical protein
MRTDVKASRIRDTSLDTSDGTRALPGAAGGDATPSTHRPLIRSRCLNNTKTHATKGPLAPVAVEVRGARCGMPRPRAESL